jgi:hypothetical protein
MKYSHIPNGDMLMDEVEVELGMLCTLMLDEVGGEVHGADVVTIDKGAPHQRTMQLLEYLTKPCRLDDAISHSVVLGLGAERKTTGCRFEDQETRLSPRNTAKPDVDRRLLGQVVQSASMRLMVTDHRRRRPQLVVPQRYHRILFTTVRCGSRGTCIWRHTCWTV